MTAPSRSAIPSPRPSSWLLENGPKELELLLRAIVCQPAASILIADNDRLYLEASAGAGKLLGVAREKIIGRRMDDFAESASKPKLSELWRAFLSNGRHEGTLHLEGPDGRVRPIEFVARTNVLPVRHVVALRDTSHDSEGEPIPAWVQDYALYLLDVEGCVVAWYEGAARIYGFSAEDAAGQHLSFLYLRDDDLNTRLHAELSRSENAGHFGNEGWQIRKDGSRFWANVITTALRNESGELQGFARAVRDFSDRHQKDESLRHSPAHLRPVPVELAIAGIVSGEFDRTPEVNDAFLEIIGYTLEDVSSGRMKWAELTPPEYAALDELAHEEGLRFGTCTPYEKDLIRADGVRVPVLITTAVLKISPFRWITFVRDLRERERVERIEDQGDDVKDNFEEMVGSSAVMRRLQRLIEVVAPTDATVLILGETGTGKELIARAIHNLSARRDHTFVKVNCAAIPLGLLESELFGHEKGAFTGAIARRTGRFEVAHQGTLFLDEVGDIPPELQPKLLRVLQEQEFERLGSTHTIKVNVRLVAATSRNLPAMVEQREFRGDLYYRLNIFPLVVPPLRERSDDIPPLVEYFVARFAERLGRKVSRIDRQTMELLQGYHWPGHIRELQNVIERSVILAEGGTLHIDPSVLGSGASRKAPTDGDVLRQNEKESIEAALAETKGRIAGPRGAAARLRIPASTLESKIRALKIDKFKFRS